MAPWRPISGREHLLRKGADFEAFQLDVIEAHHGHSTRILSDRVLSNDWHFAV